MKVSVLFLVSIIFMGCVSAPPYVPSTFFPEGEIAVTPRLNKDLTGPLHKFIVIDFMNDNRDWVEVSDFKVSLPEGEEGYILENQAQIDEWLFLRSEEVVREERSKAIGASIFFSLFGLGLAIAEIASDSDDNTASSIAFDISDTLDYHAEVDSAVKASRLHADISSGQASRSINLPPGKLTKRWFVVYSPSGTVPEKILLSFNAKSSMTGQSQRKQIELIAQGRR